MAGLGPPSTTPSRSPAQQSDDSAEYRCVRCSRSASPAAVTHLPCSSQPSQFPLGNCPRLPRDHVPKCVGGIVDTDPILIRIHLQHILRAIRIVLQRRQRLYKPTALTMNEQTRSNFASGSPNRCRISAHSLGGQASLTRRDPRRTNTSPWAEAPRLPSNHRYAMKAGGGNTRASTLSPSSADRTTKPPATRQFAVPRNALRRDKLAKTCPPRQLRQDDKIGPGTGVHGRGTRGDSGMPAGCLRDVTMYLRCTYDILAIYLRCISFVPLQELRHLRRARRDHIPAQREPRPHRQGLKTTWVRRQTRGFVHFTLFSFQIWISVPA